VQLGGKTKGEQEKTGGGGKLLNRHGYGRERRNQKASAKGGAKELPTRRQNPRVCWGGNHRHAGNFFIFVEQQLIQFCRAKGMEVLSVGERGENLGKEEEVTKLHVLARRK